MKTAIRLFAALAVCTCLQARAAKEMTAPDAKARAKETSAALGEYYGKLTQAKTVGELLKAVDANLQADMKSFLAAKAAGSENEAITITREGADGLAFKFEGMMLPFKYLGENDAGPHFELNHKKIDYDPSNPPEVLWDKVAAAMPKKSAGVYDLVVPQAQAVVQAVLFGVSAVSGVAAGVINYISCDMISKDLKFCTEYGGIRNAYFRQKSVDRAQRFTSKICSDAEALLKCLDGSPGDHGGARKSKKKTEGPIN